VALDHFAVLRQVADGHAVGAAKRVVSICSSPSTSIVTAATSREKRTR
jgi:hypothetical protein